MNKLTSIIELSYLVIMSVGWASLCANIALSREASHLLIASYTAGLRLNARIVIPWENLVPPMALTNTVDPRETSRAMESQGMAT